MNIPHSLSFVIQRSHSLTEILESAVDLIAREIGTDVCSIYLLDPRDHRLRLMATHGLDKAALGKVVLAVGEGITGTVVKEMRSIAVEDASTHPGYRYFPETKEERFHSFLGVPLAIRNRPVGALVVQTQERRAYTQEEIQTLSTIAAQLVGVVENARLIEALDRGREGVRYLEEVRSWHASTGGVRAERQPDLILGGASAAPGIAIGEALFRGSHEPLFDLFKLAPQGPEKERERLREAVKKTREEILRIQEAAQREADEEHALIFSSHLLLLNDPVLLERIEGAIGKGDTAESAAYQALEHFASRLQGVADTYIQERIEDILDLRSRLLGQLRSGQRQESSVSDRIVVAQGIAPSLVVELKAQGAKGIITERGGPTSHGALLARSMGIPAVTGIRDLLHSVHSGDSLVLDGDSGLVVVSPTAATLQRYELVLQENESRRLLSTPYRERPGVSRDGVVVPLHANIAVSADLPRARECGAEGIGLYRTEFPFIIREDFPTREEQVRIYRKAYEYFPNGPVHFRLLDLGGDKFLPGASLAPDRNPFRGYRSIRILLDNPNLLRDQVQAFLRAAGARPLGILIPMVSSVSELKEVRQRLTEAMNELEDNNLNRMPRIGAMIEIPAAVEIAAELARHVDFFSIGSNDLIQYALAADRENARAAVHANPYHPAVLRMIRRTIAAGHAAGKKVALCGELASRPSLALALVAMGIDALSLAPGSIPDLKRILAATEVRKLTGEIDSILGLSEAEEIEAALARFLPEPVDARA